MANNNKEAGFKTDVFTGALQKNDEMNKTGKIKNEEPTPSASSQSVAFKTDAFKEALKINEETNKKDSPQTTSNTSND